MSDYQLIAEKLATDILEGRLRPGDRLPAQRAFAHTRGIAISTASRVYGELVRRGLVTGETGRGTYVRTAVAMPGPALAEPPAVGIDLEINYPIFPHHHPLMLRALKVLAGRPEGFSEALRPISVQGTASARETVASCLSYGGWHPEPGSLLFAGSGRQALTAALSALVPVGGQVGFEALTYPFSKAAARRLGISAIPLAMDEDGVKPDAIEEAARYAPLHAIYIQPTAQNPLGTTMSAGRRQNIIAMVRKLSPPGKEPIRIVEDAVYSFLEPDAPPPFAALAPDIAILVDSFSKRMSPGLTLGTLCGPTALAGKLANALRSGGWGVPGFSLDVGVRWAADGIIADLEIAKRDDAAKRQAIAQKALSDLQIRANPSTYHLWLELPERWRAEVFALAAARRGIVVTPAAAFAVKSAHAPNAVRIALANPDIKILESALVQISAIAKSEPDVING